MRLTLVISSLVGGGAERLAAQLASAWVQQEKQVTLLTFDDDTRQGWPIHASVNHRRLCLLAISGSSFHGALQNLRRIRVLRRAIRESKPDIVISFQDCTNILTLFATFRLGKPVIIYELNNLVGHEIGRIWGLLRRLSYRFADALVCLTNSGRTQLMTLTKVKGWVIPPFVAPPPAPANLERRKEKSSRAIVAIGRLVHPKGFDLLLDAFVRIADHHPDWSLTIFGDGPLRTALEEQSAALHLTGRVHFAGASGEPFAALSGSDLFVFSSRFESFGIALGEAMSYGLPVVSFDCEAGPADIVRHGVDGILVPPEDVAALAGALDRLMGNPQERERLAARAPEVLRRFGADRILDMWQKLFDTLV